MTLKEIILYPDGKAVFDCETHSVEGIWGSYDTRKGETVYQFIFSEPFSEKTLALANHIQRLKEPEFQGLLNDIGVT